MMLFVAHFLVYQLSLSWNAQAIKFDEIDDNDRNSNLKSPNHTVDWYLNLDWMVEQFQQHSRNEELVDQLRVQADLSSSEANVPYLIPVFVIPTESVHIGSIVSDKAIMTACSATVILIDEMMMMMMKADDVVVVLEIVIESKVVPALAGIAEIRRHPTCSKPFKQGSWKNNVAFLMFSIAMKFTPNIMEPIKLPSHDFFEIYYSIRNIVTGESNASCHAIIMQYHGAEIPRIKLLLPVRIKKSNGCVRTCGYNMDHCTQELGGYSVHLINTEDIDKIRREAPHGAAVVCNGAIYGVMEPDFTCGYASIGQLPKPEAMLYMYLNFGDPNLKLKAIIGPNSSERNGCNIAVYSIVLSWVIAFSIESFGPLMTF